MSVGNRNNQPWAQSYPGFDLDAGSLLDEKYEIIELLGRGGMGRVFKARHLLMNRNVAIKVLLPEFAGDEESRQRFFREARAAATIESPHVVQVYDVGILASDTPYIVMELLVGTNLRQLMDARPQLDIGLAAGIMLQVCRGVGQAHRMSITHRDLKPGNIFLVEREDGPTIAKVLDFGISKVADHFIGQGQLTASSIAMGSPAYMSPEQIRSTKHADRRSDVWSIGVMLYEAISGVRPFYAPSLAEACAAVTHSTPDSLISLIPNCPQGLNDTVMRCLSKEPEDRYQSAEALANALIPYASSALAPPQIRSGAEDRLPSEAETMTAAPKGTYEGFHTTTEVVDPTIRDLQLSPTEAPPKFEEPELPEREAIPLPPAYGADPALENMNTTIDLPPRRRAIHWGIVAMVATIAVVILMYVLLSMRG